MMWSRMWVRTASVLRPIVASLTIFSLVLPAQSGSTKEIKAPISQLEHDVPDLMKKGGVPGVAIAVVRGGKTTWVHGLGVKNANNAQPVTTETVFEAASLSKPVFAYGVLKLVEQGKLGLDVPLTTYLPKPFVAGDERLAKITARIVLSHRIGFPNWPADDGSVSIYFTPGERFSYSGEGYIYLQRVVEKITGEGLNEYMTEAVFTPLGMTSSSYVWRPDFDALTATVTTQTESRPSWRSQQRRDLLRR